MADAHNRLFIPNVEEFFNDLLQLLYQCDENDLDEGVAEITCRRFEEYQQTLRVMYSRVREYRPNEALQLNYRRLGALTCYCKPQNRATSVVL